MPQRYVALVLILAFSALLAGCRRNEKPAPPKNLLEWFQQKQSDIETGEGRIDVDSARMLDDQTVQYDTVEGGKRRTFKMRFQPAGKGEYKPIGEREEVKATP